MGTDLGVLDQTERIIYALRALYMNSGYTRYKMSKFEEYDLYSRNKSFLVSDEVITFTDADGRLMALKPDVTLSIIKNTRDGGGLQKLCYNENVYRAAGGIRVFREIMQTGVECIGDIGPEEIGEVLVLAARSLEKLNPEFILEVSDLGILSLFVDSLHLKNNDTDSVLQLIHSKNVHELRELCERNNLDEEACKELIQLLKISHEPEKAIALLKSICTQNTVRQRVESFEGILRPLVEKGLKEHIRVDFSLSGNMNYYNGIIFKGYVSKVAQSVLSGGQYDRLMQRLGRSAKAIGFAVYLDRLERLSGEQEGGETVC